MQGRLWLVDGHAAPHEDGTNHCSISCPCLCPHFINYFLSHNGAMQRLLYALLPILLVIGDGLAVQAQPTPGSSPTNASELLPLINEARSAARMCGDERFPAAPPVAWSDTLAQAATAHNNDMSTNAFRGHAGSDGSVPHERVRNRTDQFASVGEVLAYFQNNSAETVDAWLGSPDHCRIVMDAAYTHVGTARATGPRYNAPNQTGTYRTAVFGANPDAPRPTVRTNVDSSEQQDSSPEAADIVVYGRDTCPNTTALRRALDNEGIPYTMRDIDDEAGASDAMWDLLYSADEVIGSTRLPVVEANGVVFGGIRSADRIEQALRSDL